MIDISNLPSLTWVGVCDTSGIAFGVVVSGSHAYGADGPAGLQVINIRAAG